MNIFIGIPTYDRKVDIELMTGFVGLINRYANEHTFMLDYISGSIISNSRNYLVSRFLNETPCDHLLFWDADIVVRNPDFIAMMLETESKLSAAIVGGPYRIKDNSKRYAVGVIDPHEKHIVNKRVGELTQPQFIDTVATGMMLINRKVFEKIPDPWFEIIEQPGGGVVPEDYNFCLKAKRAGFEVAVDPRFAIDHFGTAFWSHTPNESLQEGQQIKVGLPDYES